MSCVSSCAPPAAPIITVVGPEFVMAYRMDMVITKKRMTLREGSFSVTDHNGNIVFRVTGSVFNRRHTWVLLDAADRPIVTLRQKISSICEAYRGNSSDPKDFLFIVEKSSLHLDVYFPQNTNRQVPDFKIRGKTIYLGNSLTAIAEIMEKDSTLRSMIGKDTYAVTVNANIDYAFVVSLFIAFYEFEEDSSFRTLFKSDHMCDDICDAALSFIDAIIT